jgi:hypothetical protein
MSEKTVVGNAKHKTNRVKIRQHCANCSKDPKTNRPWLGDVSPAEIRRKNCV